MITLDNEREYYLQLIYKRCRKRMSYVDRGQIDADFRKKYPSNPIHEVQMSLYNDMGMIEWPKSMNDNRMRLTERGMEYCLENFSFTHIAMGLLGRWANYARGR